MCHGFELQYRLQPYKDPLPLAEIGIARGLVF